MDAEWDRFAFQSSFSPDGRRIVTTACEPNMAVLSDGKTGAFIEVLKGHTDVVWPASFSPDGMRIVTPSSDGTARLWDAERGTHIVTLEGHTSEVLSASFSPDGTQIVTASGDRTARLWDGEAGEPIVTLKGHKDLVNWASFSPNGAQMVTVGVWKDERPLALLALLPGILLGLLGGLRMPVQEDRGPPDQARQDKVSPTRGIKRSAALAALVGFAVTLVATSLVAAADLLLTSRLNPSEVSLALPGPLGLFAGAVVILVGLAYGGLDVLYHYLLRFLLAVTRQTPWRYVTFLDYAVQRIFLRRIGGSYTFIHPLLRDHFAGLYREESGQVPIE
jgi:hypothetical protein